MESHISCYYIYLYLQTQHDATIKKHKQCGIVFGFPVDLLHHNPVVLALCLTVKNVHSEYALATYWTQNNKKHVISLVQLD